MLVPHQDGVDAEPRLVVLLSASSLASALGTLIIRVGLATLSTHRLSPQILQTPQTWKGKMFAWLFVLYTANLAYFEVCCFGNFTNDQNASTSLSDLKKNVAAADVVFSDLKGIANTDIRQFWVRTGPDYNRWIIDP